MSIKKCCQLAIITAAVATLMACGGGGGTENQDQRPNTDPAQPSLPQSPHTPKNAAKVWGWVQDQRRCRLHRGWTGDGVTIGYYEFAIDGSHPELSGKVVDNPYDEIEPGSYTNVVYTLAEATQHAQRAAGVAAAKRNKIGMHGVAYDSRIEFVSSQNKTFNDLIDQQLHRRPVQHRGSRDARSVNYLNGRVPIAFNAQVRGL